MTLDDDSLLSAYMDGQLDPEQYQTVESALVSDPQLAEQFRHLTTVRELLAGLSRDAPVDVTVPVLNRIRMRLRLRAILAAPTPRWTRAPAVLGIAATILFALAISLSPMRRLLAPDGPEGNRNPLTTALRTSPRPTIPIPQLDAPERREPSFVSLSDRDASGEVGSADRQPGNPHGAPGGVLEPAEIEHARQYLDNPNLRHVLMIADMDGTAQQQVASVVEQTTRFNYVKITIAQGVVIDPRHPDQATVFALVVSPSELETLRHRLRVALNDRVKEPPVDPRIVTQLADIGDVQTFKPSPAGEVVIPHDALAIKHPNDGRPEPQDRPPTLEQYRSAPRTNLAPSRSGAAPRSEANRSLVAGAGIVNSADASKTAPAPAPGRVAARSDARGPGGPPEPAEKPDQSLVVLVWVSRARSDLGH
jgi:hypothetical protein